MDSILPFWFPEKNISQNFWFSPKLDNLMTKKFGELLIDKATELARSEPDYTKMTLDEKMAIVILFDQIARNINRKNRYVLRQYDPIALKVAHPVVWHMLESKSFIRQDYMMFFCLPLRHSKNIHLIHQVINLINLYEKNDWVANISLWTNFKLASYRSLYNHQYTSVVPKLCLSNFKSDMVTFYGSVFDEDVNLSNWTTEIDLKNPLVKTVNESILKYDSHPKSVSVSLSGGVDSMVGAHIVCGLAKIMGFIPRAYHIEYTNRKEAKLESKAIEWYAHHLGIIYQTIKVDHMIRPENKRTDLTELDKKYKIVPRKLFESETRRNRFDFYRTNQEEHGVKLVLLGHHLDDVIENTIANVCQGRDPDDLPVLCEYEKQDGVGIWRPFIVHYKDNIIKYANDYGIPYMYNSTPPLCMRGRMRREVIPLLMDVFPQFKVDVPRTAEKSRDLKLMKESMFVTFSNTLKKGKMGFMLNVKPILEMTKSLWGNAFANVFHSMGISRLKESKINELYELVTNKTEFTTHMYKRYITYYNPESNDLIFLNKDKTCEIDPIKFSEYVSKYPKITISKHTGNPIKSNLESLINGNIRYTVECSDSKEIILGNTLQKKLKKSYREMFDIPLSLLNNYIWTNARLGKDLFVEIEY